MVRVRLAALVAVVVAVPACTLVVETAPGMDAAVTDAASHRDAAAVDAPPPDAPVDAAVDANLHVCPPPGALDCSPGTGSGLGDQCFDGPACYLNAVKAAINGVIAAHPSWFGVGPNGCPLILDVDVFLDAVVADVVARGHCAIRDPNAPGEEITVKRDNGFSENFDIVAWTGCARYGDGIYTGYCAPAWW